MTQEEAQRVATLTAHMSTRCMGRYLIDLPANFVLNSESSTEIEGIAIKITPADRSMFDQAVVARELELQRSRLDSSPNRPVLKKVETTAVIPIGKVFNRAESSGAAEFARTLELWAWKNGFEIRMLLNATDGTDIPFDTSVIGTAYEVSERRTWDEYRSKNDIPEKLAHLLEVYERISGRKDTEIPAEQGVCFANGFLKGPPTDKEVLLIQHHLDGASDVSTAFHSLSDLVQSDALLDRGSSIDAMLKETGGRTLRKGTALSQIPDAQEWLMSKKDFDSGLMYQYLTLEANATTGSAATPVVVFNLDAGTAIPRPPQTLEQAAVREPLKAATFSEAASIALWDKISATLRRRPGAF